MGASDSSFIRVHLFSLLCFETRAGPLPLFRGGGARRRDDGQLSQVQGVGDRALQDAGEGNFFHQS